MSYIVRNCPCLSMAEYPSGKVEDNLCGLAITQYCKDCTDCLIKKVIEKCKDIECPCEFNGADCWECSTAGQKTLAEQILQLFEIEECE